MAADDDDDYNEDEDLDFAPEDVQGGSESDDESGTGEADLQNPVTAKRPNDTDSGQLDSGDEATIGSTAKKPRHENKHTIVTRSRIKKSEDGKKDRERSKPREPDLNRDLDGLWKKLNEDATDGADVPTGQAALLSAGEDMIEIQREYEFAGELIRETKQVPRNSAEAIEYLKIQERKSQQQRQLPAKPHAQKRNKRSSVLDQFASTQTKPTKLNVLQKSNLDWAKFVDREGINDDLKHHNKDGYVEKQAFLRRTEERRDYRPS